MSWLLGPAGVQAPACMAHANSGVSRAIEREPRSAHCPRPACSKLSPPEASQKLIISYSRNIPPQLTFRIQVIFLSQRVVGSQGFICLSQEGMTAVSLHQAQQQLPVQPFPEGGRRRRLRSGAASASQRGSLKILVDYHFIFDKLQ